jgi:hypothetical protein
MERRYDSRESFRPQEGSPFFLRSQCGFGSVSNQDQTTLSDRPGGRLSDLTFQGPPNAGVDLEFNISGQRTELGYRGDLGYECKSRKIVVGRHQRASRL